MNAHVAPAAVSRTIGRSALAVLAGLAISILLALAIDLILHALQVFPPWNEPMTEPGDNALALAYRIGIATFSCYVAARLAPAAPMRHALILGAIGMALATLGLVAATVMNIGLLWYPVALVVTALPCAWVGGALARRSAS